jgi:hypothetical protein
MRSARRAGKRHAKQGLPDHNWAGGAVPYLQALHARYQGKIETVNQTEVRYKGQSLTSKDLDSSKKANLQSTLVQVDREIAYFDEVLKERLAHKIGGQDENPGGRAARHREVPIYLYLMSLAALSLGEFFVTYPAVRLILGDKGWKAFLVTGSFSALSVIVAHLFGMSFKGNLNRERPQPRGAIIGLVFLGIGIFLVLIFLSALRANNVEGAAYTFGLSDSTFGFLLFMVLQTTFVLAAIGLSYYNHSEVDAEISHAKRALKRLRRRQNRLNNSLNTPDSGVLTGDKQAIQTQSIENERNRIRSQYREIAAIYRESNLLAQAQNFSEPGPGLTEPEL